MQSSVRSRNQLIVGGAMLGALAVILTTISQALVLSFPLIPYLQFDLGEIAIILAFFIFGPGPAVTASVVEFLALMAIGQNAPWGPVLKLVAIVSSIVGIWMGMAIVSRRSHPSVGMAAGLGTSVGLVTRAIMMTFANYLVIVFVYTVNGIVGAVRAPFLLIGVTLTEGNALALVLGFTAVFNVLQLIIVAAISYFLLRLPQVKNVGALGKPFWVTSYIRSND